ncbi:MAG TPA: hypothetical protein VHM88_13145 [Candidatus Acidoferrales bacterium]|jgi:hypothetical protein|nr:hypothetical protein [Candidatus Acidoferrales bacterium]
MRSLWRLFVRTVFWSYERGTWPYDVAVVAIVLFVLLSPRSWFHDQPQFGPPPAGVQVALLEDLASGRKTYRVDARLLASPIRTPELEHEIHEAVRKNVDELRRHTFHIERIEPIRGEGGTIIYYDVQVRP